MFLIIFYLADLYARQLHHVYPYAQKSPGVIPPKISSDLILSSQQWNTK